MLASFLASLCLVVPAVQEDGAIAPAGAWVTHGGSPARNRATLTPPLRSTPHLGWSYAAPGPIEGEPLVWGGSVIVTFSDEKERGLALLDLRDGSVVDELRFPSAARELAPALWDGVLVVRADELRAYRVGTRRLREVWSRNGAFGPPLLYGDEVYAVESAGLTRLDAATGETVWRQGRGLHGRPSLRGDAVYVLGRSGDHVTIDAVSRKDGSPLSSVQPVSAPGGVPRSGPGAAFVAVMAKDRVVYLENGVQWAPGQISRSLVAGADQRSPKNKVSATSLFHRAEAAEVLTGWLVTIPWEESALWLQTLDEGFVPLASKEDHPELAARDDAPCRVGSAAYFAGAAVDLDTHVVLWHLDGEPAGPMIPARDALLVQRDERHLEAWRTRDPVRHSDLSYGVVLGNASGERIVGARAVLADSSIEAGDFLIEKRRGEMSLVKVRRDGSNKDLSRHVLHPLASTLLLIDANDRIRYAAGALSFLRGADALIDESLGDDYAELAIDALPAKDYDLVGKIVARARECGVEEKRLKRAVDLLERKAAEGAANRKDDKAVLIETRVAELGRRRPDRLHAMASALPEAEHDLRYQLLRAALLDDPSHAGSLAVLDTLDPLLRASLLSEVERERPGDPALAAKVKSLLPAGLQPPEPFQTEEWLKFLAAIAHAPVTILDPKPAAPDLGPEERKLGAASLRWRKDLKGFRSENLFVITPVSRPGAIARCLAMGELVCQALDEIFAGGENRRDTRYPLYINLYDSKEEYLEQSASRGGHSGLGWTAGHFDELDNLSRLYLPSGDESFEEVTQTFVHELTHQWVRNRCPLFTNEEAVQRLHKPPTGGYWIVEGFASLIEEFRFDGTAWRWTTENATSRRRDLATSAEEDQRVPWTELFAADRAAFGKLSKASSLRVPLRTRLGRVGLASPTSLFYAQAQTACYYLFAGADGAHRGALRDYLAAYYRGEDAKLDVASAFGMSADELGKRALAFARENLH